MALGLALAACTSSAPDSQGSAGGSDSGGAMHSTGGADATGAAHGGDAGAGVVAGAAGEPGAGGSSGSAGEPDSLGASGTGADGGTSGTAGTDAGGATNAAGASGAEALTEGTLLYVRHETTDHDWLIARDLTRDKERVITDLTGDGSSGWEIGGYSLSPDRRRIAIASLYGPTAADNATGLATRAIWTLDTAGNDFRRLTPTFPNNAQGRQNFQYEVADPEWTADGKHVLYDFGEYWWEGSNLAGGTFPWIVSAAGNEPPTTFSSGADCSVLHPARNPATGDFLFIHSVCVPGQGDGDGLYLYPADGSTSPQQLVPSGRAAGSIDVYLGKPSWLADGSGFLFLGGISETDWRPSLLGYDLGTGNVSLLVGAPEGTVVDAVAISPDSSKLVYCLSTNDGEEDLHLIDLAAASPTDTALTTDGKSCDPSF